MLGRQNSWVCVCVCKQLHNLQIAELGPDVADHGLRTPLMYAVLGNQKKACQVSGT